MYALEIFFKDSKPGMKMNKLRLTALTSAIVIVTITVALSLVFTRKSENSSTTWSTGLPASLITSTALTTAPSTVQSSVYEATKTLHPAPTEASTCDLSFASPQRLTNTSLDGVFSIAAAHFDTDPHLDIVTANNVANTVSIFLGNGDGTFRYTVDYPTGSGTPNFVTTSDLNSDMIMDIIVANNDEDGIGILLGNGDGTFQNQMSRSTIAGSAPESLTIGYINDDVYPDIVVALGGTDSDPTSVIIGDFNRDHRADVIATIFGKLRVALFLGFGNGSMQSQINFNVSTYPIRIYGSDFNGDGDLDIAVYSDGTGDVDILLGSGHATFISAGTVPPSNETHAHYFALEDLDGDGRKDVIALNTNDGQIYVALGDPDGTFRTLKNFSTGTDRESYGFVAGHFNNDSRLDLAVAMIDESKVNILLGQC